MERKRARAVVIGAYPYGEADLILRVISELDGHISLLARGARKSKKRFQGRLELFDRGLIEYAPGRGSLLLIQDYVPSAPFIKLREQLHKFTVASLFCEAIDHLTSEGTHDAELYEIVSEGLEQINHGATPRDVFKTLYLSLNKLLHMTGFADRTEENTPSSHNLLRVFRLIESTTERELKSKASVLPFLNQITAKVE